MIIDVSYHNGTIQWNEVGKIIDFAILRCGFGSNIQTQDDAMFNENAHKCEKYGIPYGVYLYSYAKNIAQVESEIKHVLRCIKGRKVVYPVYYDIEETKICNTCNVSEFAELFIKRIREHGHYCGIYSGNYLFKKHFKDIDMDSRWVARYSKREPSCNYDIWQYSSKGNIKGISTNVDLNRMHNFSQFTDSFYDNIVKCVLKGDYGTGKVRKEKLFNSGINYWKVQNMINILYNM